MGVWFVGCQLCPLVGLLVALDFVVARAPPDLNRDFWFLAAELSDVLLGCDGVLLACPVHGSLSICEDCVMAKILAFSSCRFKGTGDGCALRIVGFLYESHMDLVPFHVWPFFQVTAYPVVPSSVHDPSVKMTGPGQSRS